VATIALAHCPGHRAVSAEETDDSGGTRGGDTDKMDKVGDTPILPMNQIYLKKIALEEHDSNEINQARGI